MKSDQIEVWSTGIEAHGLNPVAVRVTKKAGVDISSHQSTHIRDLLNIPFDVAVTICNHARKACPPFPRLRS